MLATQNQAMDDTEDKMSASPLTFTTRSAPEWDKKILEGLRNDCKILTGGAEEFKSHSLYAMIEDKFTGGIILEQHDTILWIDALWVELNFRKQGIGNQLLEKATQFATQHNLKEIQLNTYFNDAHDFFLFCGFKDAAV